MISRASVLERSKWIILVGLIFFTCTYIYIEQIVEWNGGYLGIVLFNWYGSHLISLLIGLLIIAFLFPLALARPSDLFIFFHLFFVCISFAAFALGKFYMSAELYAQFLLILILPLILLKLLLKIKLPRVRGYRQTRDRRLLLANYMIAASAFVAGVSVYFAPSSASLDFFDVYTRRIDARLVMPDGSLLMYANQMTTQMIVPMAAAIYGFNRKVFGFLLCVLISVAFFYVDGSKSILITTIAAFILGFYRFRSSRVYPVNSLLLLIVALFLVFVVEAMNNQVSLAGQYFFRRFFIVPGVVVSAYIEAFFDSSMIWSPLTGMQLPESVSYYVGEVMFGHKGDNSGTNAFISSLASSGIPGYLITTVVVVGFYRVLDLFYKQTGDPSFFFIGFLYATKLVEQNALTALSSSGVALAFFLLLVVNYKQTNSEQKELSTRI